MYTNYAYNKALYLKGVALKNNYFYNVSSEYRKEYARARHAYARIYMMCYSVGVADEASE